jgi:hypothetical protein
LLVEGGSRGGSKGLSGLWRDPLSAEFAERRFGGFPQCFYLAFPSDDPPELRDGLWITDLPQQPCRMTSRRPPSVFQGFDQYGAASPPKFNSAFSALSRTLQWGSSMAFSVSNWE